MRTVVIAGRLIRQVSGDKRTLFLILLAPVFILFILNVVLTSGVTKAKIDVLNTVKADISVLRDSAIVTEPADEDAALADLKEGRVDAYLVVRETKDKLVIEGTDPTLTGLVKATYAKFAADRASKTITDKLSALDGLVTKLPENAKKLVQLPSEDSMKAQEPEISYLYAGDFTFFDTIAAGIMGFIIFFLVFLLSGISFLRERISGTLERVMASSVRRWEVVTGYILGFGLFVLLQTVIIQSFLLYVLNVHFAGSFWSILVVNLVSAMASLALGTLLSAFARNEFQLIQFVPIVIIPQVLFSGLFDLRDAPNWVNWLSQVFPLTYSSDALKGIMIRGESLGDVWLNILVLLGFTAVFVTLNIRALRKYRKA